MNIPMSKKQNNPLLNLFKIGNREAKNEQSGSQKIETLYKNAVEYFKNNDFYPAEECFLKIYEIEPNYLDSTLYLAKIHINKFEHAKAIPLLKQYLNEVPNSFEAKMELSSAYIKNKDFELSIILLNQLKNSPSESANLTEVTSKLAQVYYYQGDNFKSLKKFKEALACYEQAEKYDSDKIKNLFHIALCYKEMKKYSKAIEKFNEMIKLYEQVDDRKYNPNIYLHLGDIEERQGNVGRAIQVYQKFLQIEPQTPLLNFFKGKINFLQKNYDQALNDFQEALKLKIFLEEIYSEVGKCYLAMNHLNSALDIYQNLLSIEVSNINAELNIAVIKLKLGNFEDAYKFFSTLDEEYLQDNPEITKYLGKCLLELGMSDQAFKNLSKAKSLYPEDAETRVFLSQLYKKNGDNVFYEKELKKAIELDPNNFTVLKELATSHKENKEFDKAIQIYNKMLEVNVNDKEALKLIADLHRDNRNFKEALHYYKEYMIDLISNSYIVYEIALCYFELADMDNAIEEFEKLQNNNKYLFIASSYLVSIYISKDDMDKAWEYLQKCLEVNPNYTEGYLKCGKVCIHLGQIQRAIEYFEHVLKLEPNNVEAAELIKSYSSSK